MNSYFKFIQLIIFLFILTACGNESEESPSIIATHTEPPSNTVPFITSVNSIIIEENALNVMKVIAIDGDGDGVTFSIASLFDYALFTIDSITGEFDFIVAPDYENPKDGDVNNSYEVQVLVSDGIDTVSQIITINVTDQTEVIENCRRVVRNNLSFYSSDFTTWGSTPSKDDLVFSNNSNKVTFDLINTSGSRLFIGKDVSLEKSKRYAFRIKVTEFEGGFGVDNFVIQGGDDNDFIGKRSIRFSQDGVYGMVFDYVGENGNYLLRVGIGTKGNDLVAYNATVTRFSVQNVMWEELRLDDFDPSEYVPPMNSWCFGYEKRNVLDTGSALLLEGAGNIYNELYKSVWAISADSFGNDSADFPQKLLNIVSSDYGFYVDAIPGRTLENALVVFEDLLTVQSYPDGVVKPYGIIIQGGVNDILTNATSNDLQNTVLKMLQIVNDHDLKSIILTVPPFKAYKNWNPSREIVRIEYNEWIKSNLYGIEGVYIVDISAPKSSGGLADDSDIELLDQEYGLDGLHPNTEGTKVIADRIKEVLDDLY